MPPRGEGTPHAKEVLKKAMDVRKSRSDILGEVKEIEASRKSTKDWEFPNHQNEVVRRMSLHV